MTHALVAVAPSDTLGLVLQMAAVGALFGTALAAGIALIEDLL